MKTVIAVRPTSKGYNTRCTAVLAAALDARVADRTAYTLSEDDDLLIQWGYLRTPAIRSAIALRKPFIILDRGYFDPDRVQRVSVSFNGHGGLSMELDGVENRPPRYHPEIQPMREGGETIQIIGQMEGDASLRGASIAAWMNRKAIEAHDQYHLKVIKRAHPRMLNPWEPAQEPLEDTFDDTLISISYSSTAAVQTTLAGVRSVVEHPASLAYEVRRDSRPLWAHKLSQREYNLLDPVDSVECVQYILDGYDQAKREASQGAYDTLGMNR
jgi:hypothetical protein